MGREKRAARTSIADRGKRIKIMRSGASVCANVSMKSIKSYDVLTDTPPRHPGRVSRAVGQPPVRKWPSFCQTSMPNVACCGEAGNGSDRESMLDVAEDDNEYRL